MNDELVPHFPANDSGCWITDDPKHSFDSGLNDYLLKFLPNTTVFDFGCGDGSYIKNLKSVCFDVGGCDGNPFTEQLTDGLAFEADLSIPQNFGMYDWVLSFEVGEHLPKEFESIFIDNLCNHANRGIIMSWAFPDQPGQYHVNCQSSNYIIAEFHKRGFLVDIAASLKMRDSAHEWWFKCNLLKFYNIKS